MSRGRAKFEREQRAAIIARLRDRDGDECRICLLPLDFTISEPRHPGLATIDHIIPLKKCRGAEGRDGLPNLQLAHQECNGLRARSAKPNPDRRPEWFARQLNHALSTWPKPSRREKIAMKKARSLDHIDVI